MDVLDLHLSEGEFEDSQSEEEVDKVLSVMVHVGKSVALQYDL